MITTQNNEFEKILALYKKNQLLDAKNKCEKFILKNKKNIRAYQLMAKIEQSSGQAHKAISILQAALKDNPENVGLLLDLGNIQKDLNLFAESFECYHKVSKIDPLNLVAYHNCANLMFKIGSYKQAIDLYSKAYHLDNTHVNSLIGIAKSYESLEDYINAVGIYEGILNKFAVNEYALLGLGNLLRKINQHEKALTIAEELVANYSKNEKSYYLRGVVKKELGMLTEALDDFTKIIEISPEAYLAQNNKAMTLLMMGDFRNGWPLYEARWQLEEGRKKKYQSSRPLWEGQENGTLLVWAEQGVGDQVMYSAILSEAAASVKKLIVLVDKRLKTLFNRSFDSNIKFITTREEAESSEYDFHLPMASLAKFFRNSEDEFRRTPIGYLVADSKQIAHLRQLCDKKENEKLIGVSWKSINPKNGSKRGVALLEFLEKINTPGVRFVNLQYGDITEDLVSLSAHPDFKLITLDEVDNFENIDGLAALISVCDEVISIDNSTVHLSGALGQKTKVLLQKSPDWRWQQNRTDTPWYPSVQLIRDAIY